MSALNKAVEQIHKKGYLAIVVTNQSGVARGYLTEEMLQKLNAYLQKETGKVISKQAKRQERKPIGVSIAGLTSYRHKSKKYMVLQNCVPDSYRPQLFCLHNS